MLQKIYKSLFGDLNEKKVKKYFTLVEESKKIEEILEKELTTVEKVQAKTKEFQTKFE